MIACAYAFPTFLKAYPQSGLDNQVFGSLPTAVYSSSALFAFLAMA